MTNFAPSDLQISSRWRWPVRIFWLAAALLLFSLYFAGLEPAFREWSEICLAETCPILTITPGELQILESYGLSVKAFAIFYFVLETTLILFFTILAGLVFWRRSDTWVGFVVSQAFLFAGLGFFGEEIRAAARITPDLQSLVDFLTSVSVVLMLMIFYIFPDGKFTPRWMGWFAGALIAAVVIDLVFNETGAQTSSASMFLILTFAAGVPMGLISQIYRYRKISTSTQRQQTKWVLYGILSMFAGILPWLIFGEIAVIAPGPGRLWFYLSLIPQYTLVAMFPVAVAVAILRYRLWDIDLVIRRTLQYGLLTGLLALAYFFGVVILQAVLTPLTGTSESPLVTVLSTLGIAALFNPLRGRVQDFIDRRFYRQKYDSAQALSHFSDTVRDVVDLQALSGALLEVVEETMQPERSDLWLKD